MAQLQPTGSHNFYWGIVLWSSRVHPIMSTFIWTFYHGTIMFQLKETWKTCWEGEGAKVIIFATKEKLKC